MTSNVINNFKISQSFNSFALGGRGGVDSLIFDENLFLTYTHAFSKMNILKRMNVFLYGLYVGAPAPISFIVLGPGITREAVLYG